MRANDEKAYFSKNTWLQKSEEILDALFDDKEQKKDFVLPVLNKLVQYVRINIKPSDQIYGDLKNLFEKICKLRYEFNRDNEILQLIENLMPEKCIHDIKEKKRKSTGGLLKGLVSPKGEKENLHSHLSYFYKTLKIAFDHSFAKENSNVKLF